MTDFSYDEDNAARPLMIRPHSPKVAGVGKTFLFGQTLVYDETTDKWDLAASGSSGRLGICTNPDTLTHATNEQTGEVITTRGVSEDATACSVLTEGVFTKQVEGAIAPGNYVKVASTDPNKVMQWDSALDALGLVVGTYIINVTQRHNANEPAPAAVDGDWIKIHKRKVNT